MRSTGLRATEFAAGLLASEQVAVTPMHGWGSDDFGEYLVRLIFTNEPGAAARGGPADRPVQCVSMTSRLAKKPCSPRVQVRPFSSETHVKPSRSQVVP